MVLDTQQELLLLYSLGKVLGKKIKFDVNVISYLTEAGFKDPLLMTFGMRWMF